MADYLGWWANRAGQYQSATVTPVRPTGDPGAAIQLATAPLTPRQSTDFVNDVITVRDEEVAQEEQKSLWQNIMGGVGSAIGWVGDRFSDINTARRDTQAALFGEKYADWSQQTEQSVGSAIGTGLEEFDEHVFTPAMRGIATVRHGVNISMERQEHFWDFPILEGETWKDAWERSAHTSMGQAIMEGWGLDEGTREVFYEDGFDEYGNPLNQVYAEIRRDNLGYNLGSGTLDFLKVWYAAPEVLAAKGVTHARALHKGDLPRLSPKHQARIQRIAATPEAHLADLKKNTPAYDYVARRAIALREQTLGLRNQVREGAVSVTDLARMQAFAHSAQGPTAAHLFTEAAKAKKVDPNTGAILDDVFDDDLFDMVTAAMMGHGGAARRLEDRADEIGDAMRALNTQILHAADDAVYWGERILDVQTTPLLTEAERRLALVAPQWRLDEAVKSQDMLEQGLRQYQGYQDWVQRLFDEGPKLTMSPRDAKSFGQILQGATSATYRPTGHANVASQVIQVPRAAWLKRPGIASLHSAESSFEAGDRFLDQAVRYTKADGLDQLAQAHKADDWNTLRTKLMEHLADASTDTERLAVLNRIEDVSVAAIARKHGLTSKEARQLTDHVRGMRDSLVRQAEDAHRSYSQATMDGKRIDTFRHTNADGTQEIIRLPIDVTQLRNTFIGVDLRAMDQMLKRHNGAIRAVLGSAGDRVTSALETFNHYWKPSVLFRAGYPVRNVIDDGLRGLAATMNFGYVLGGARAAVRGAQNVPDRVYNRFYARTRNWHVNHSPKYRHAPVEPQALRESVGPIDVPDPVRRTTIGKRDSAITTWERRSLQHHARLAQSFAAGGKKPLKVEPRRPPILDRLDQALDGLDVAGVRVIDGATGRVKATASGDVADMKWETVFDSTVRVVDDLDSVDLHRYIAEFGDWLSNKGNGVMVSRLDDGRVELSVARRNLLSDRPRQTTHRPMRKSGEDAVRLRGVEFEGAFGDAGDMFRPANSSDEFNRNLYRSQELNLAKLREDNMQRTILAGEKDFEQAWTLVVNDHLRKSPIIRRMLDGWDDDRIVAWLENSAEGRRLGKRMRHKAHNPVAWVDELRAHLNHYLPDDRLRAIARERDFALDDVSNLGKWDARPVSVDMVAAKLSSGPTTMSQAINTVIDKTFHALATVPTDTLVRHPFFERNYRYQLERWLDTVDDAATITPKMRQLAEKQARQFALKQTKLYMFSLADQSELTHMFRFLSPFIGAWQESIIRWARITMERPEAFARLYMNGWDGGIDKLYGIEEDTDPLTGEPVIRVPMPTSVKRALEAVLPDVDAGDLEMFEQFLVSKKSTNVTLQGSPWWLPSGGPIVQAPAAYFLKNSPELKDENALSSFVWKWLFPAGHPGASAPEIAKNSILPTWMKQFERYHAEGDDPTYNNLFLMIYRTDYQRMKDAGETINKDKLMRESWEKAKGVQAFYTMSRLGSPFAFRLEPQSQFWIDKAREYREAYGDREGLVRFTEEMGEDAYLWWTTLSKTNLNVPPTSPGYKRYKEFQSQIERFPELAPIIVGMDAFDADFNPEVYGLQQALPVGPGDARKQRAQKTGPEYIAEVETRQGWTEYRDWRAAIEAELAARGLTNIRNAGAEDLLWANQQFIQDQKDKLPGWGRDFEQFDSGKGYAYIDTVRNFIQSGAANVNRPDLMGLAEYVEIHDAFAAELDARQLEGGKRSIEANENADLAFAWEAAMGDLVQRNPMFADIYYRYLERHTLRNGSN